MGTTYNARTTWRSRMDALDKGGDGALIPCGTFEAVCRSILKETSSSVASIEPEALEILQREAEAYLVRVLAAAQGGADDTADVVEPEHVQVARQMVDQGEDQSNIDSDTDDEPLAVDADGDIVMT